jgi:quaternary ammonium compound-resistance protein SugE
MNNPWVLLWSAGALEVIWALQLKRTEGFTKLVPSLITLSAMAISFYLLAKAVQSLPIGTAYGVWTGIGAFGTALFGILYFQEPATLGRIFFLALILVGTIGLKFTSQ